MKVYRLKKKEVESPKIGDKIEVKVDGEKQWATCMGYNDEGRPIFLFDNILTELSHDKAEKYCEERGWFLPSKKNLEEWELMQDYRYIVAGLKGRPCADWWWLTDGKGGDYFAHVNDDGVVNNTDSYWYGGVRPAFIVED